MPVGLIRRQRTSGLHFQIAATVKRGQDRETEDWEQEEHRQRIDFEVQAAAGHMPDARHRLRFSRNEHADRSHQPQGRSRDRPDLTSYLCQTKSLAESDSDESAYDKQTKDRH